MSNQWTQAFNDAFVGPTLLEKKSSQLAIKWPPPATLHLSHEVS